jgi:hypothetical protein
LLPLLQLMIDRPLLNHFGRTLQVTK